MTVEADKETNVEAAQNETSAEEAATTTTVSVPAQAAEEGTTIAAVTYEEPKASTSEEVAETPKEEAVPGDGSSHQSDTGRCGGQSSY